MAWHLRCHDMCKGSLRHNGQIWNNRKTKLSYNLKATKTTFVKWINWQYSFHRIIIQTVQCESCTKGNGNIHFPHSILILILVHWCIFCNVDQIKPTIMVFCALKHYTVLVGTVNLSLVRGNHWYLPRPTITYNQLERASIKESTLPSGVCLYPVLLWKC